MNDDHNVEHGTSKAMHYQILTILLSLPLLTATAQTTDTTRRRATESAEANLRANSLQVLNPNSFIMTIDNRYEGLVGSPYFSPEWLNGQIMMLGGKTYTNVPVKFDAYRQALILLRPKQGNDSIIIDRPTVLGFQLENKLGESYLFRRYPGAKFSEKDVADGYFMVLYEGKTALLKRVAKTIQGADYKGGYSNGARFDSFNNATSYYLLKPDQTLTRIKLTKKSLLDALADKRDALKRLADTLDLRTEADAATLVKQYDSL